MFGNSEKLDRIIELLEELSNKMDREIEFAQTRRDTVDFDHLLWLNNQVKFYETQRDERLNGESDG